MRALIVLGLLLLCAYAVHGFVGPGPGGGGNAIGAPRVAGPPPAPGAGCQISAEIPCEVGG